MFKNNILEVIGDTPIIHLEKIEKEFNLPFKLYGKLERVEPSGSIKDRAAYQIIKDAIDNNLINNDTLILEATSGNTGISLAMICAFLDLKCTIAMPSTASKERVLMMKAYGANVILTDGKLGMKGAVDEINRLHSIYKNSFLTDQFNNVSNNRAHYLYTAREILKDLNNQLDVFIAGTGTAGTLCGCARHFKETDPNIEVIGVEPLSSPLLSKGIVGPHLIQGIGANFVPGNYKKEYVDRIIAITNEESYEGARILARKEGILAGISSGAALMAALKLNSEKYRHKKVAIILPDNGERYLSVENLYDK